MKSKTMMLGIAVACWISTSLLYGCKDDELKPATGIDATLYNMAKGTTGFTWYKKSARFLNKGSKSGHPESYLRTRYNATAAAHLDSNGKVIAGTTFANGSLIVKELVNDTVNKIVSRYAILYKNPSDGNADANGWVWGYVTGSGDTKVSATEKGSGCIGCHSINGHINLTLMNYDHP
jgi:hypothetical protein